MWSSCESPSLGSPFLLIVLISPNMMLMCWCWCARVAGETGWRRGTCPERGNWLLWCGWVDMSACICMSYHSPVLANCVTWQARQQLLHDTVMNSQQVIGANMLIKQYNKIRYIGTVGLLCCRSTLQKHWFSWSSVIWDVTRQYFLWQDVNPLLVREAHPMVAPIILPKVPLLHAMLRVWHWIS